MAYAYVKAGRERDIARVLPCLLDEAHETDDPLRWAGDRCRLEHSDLFPGLRHVLRFE
jgi:hypothetical protein